MAEEYTRHYEALIERRTSRSLTELGGCLERDGFGVVHPSVSKSNRANGRLIRITKFDAVSWRQTQRRDACGEKASAAVLLPARVFLHKCYSRCTRSVLRYQAASLDAYRWERRKKGTLLYLKR